MVRWVTPARLSVRWVNRAQNTSILSLCDVTTSVCEKVRGLTSVSRCWGKFEISLWLFSSSPNPQKYVMTSEKWLDRLVSASSLCVSDGNVCTIKGSSFQR